MKVDEGTKSKNKYPSLLYRTVVRLSEAATRWDVFYKKGFLKNFTISPGNTWVGESCFKKVDRLKTCNIIKKRPQHRCFPVIIVKFLRLLISKNICEQLLFYCFNVSLLHGLKGSRPRLYDGVRLWSLSHGSSILFLSWHLSSWIESWPAFKYLRRVN